MKRINLTEVGFMFETHTHTHSQADLRNAAHNTDNLDDSQLTSLLDAHRSTVKQLNQSLHEQRDKQMQTLRDRFERARMDKIKPLNEAQTRREKYMRENMANVKGGG
jgi:hypothetical protein